MQEPISPSSSTSLAAARGELRLVHPPRVDIRGVAAAFDVAPKPLNLGPDRIGQGPLQQEGKFVYCGNLDCTAQLVGRIVHLAARRAFDIEGLGPKQVEQLVQAKLVASIEDVFTLAPKKPQLLELERWGERSTQNLLEQIDKARTPPLHRFLHGIGIRHVGESTAKDLATHFGSLARLAGANHEALMAVDGVGEEVAVTTQRPERDRGREQARPERREAHVLSALG